MECAAAAYRLIRSIQEGYKRYVRADTTSLDFRLESKFLLLWRDYELGSALFHACSLKFPATLHFSCLLISLIPEALPITLLCIICVKSNKPSCNLFHTPTKE